MGIALITNNILTDSGTALTSVITGSGTTNYLPKFTGASAIGNSAITDDGTNITLLSRGLVGSTIALTTSTLTDALLVNNGSGRGIRVNNSGAGYGVIINNETVSSAIPFLIQKSGLDKIYFTDAGAATFSSTVYTSGALQAGGTINQLYSGATKSSLYLDASRYVMSTVGTYGIAFEIGVTPVLSIPTSGNVLINTTTDAGYKLDVNGTGRFNGTSASPVLYLTNSTGGTLADFTITENTGVILNSYEGASARSIDFRVGGTSALLLASSGAATFSSSVTANGGVNAGDSKFFNSVQLTDSLGGTCQGFLWTDAANTLKIGTGTVAGGNVKMTILSGGNVGIGTTSPASKLDVVGGIVTTNGAGTTYNQFANSGSDVIWENRQNGNIIIRSNSSTERMRISTGGNVLIGTTSDAGNKLELYGSQIGLARFVGSQGSAVAITLLNNNNGNSLTSYVASSTAFGITDWINNAVLESSTGMVYSAYAGNHIFETSSSRTERMRITSAGNIGINTTGSSSIKLIVCGQDGGSSNFAFVAADNGGNTRFSVRNDGYTTTQRDACGGYVSEITNINSGDCGGSGVLILTGGRYNSSFDTTSKYLSFRRGDGTEIGAVRRNGASNVAYDTSSDYRLKEDLKDFSGLNKISKLKVYDFRWKDTPERMEGVLAHELQEVIPYAVGGEKDGVDENGKIIIQGVDYSKLVPILIKAIQEQQEQIEQLKNK